MLVPWVVSSLLTFACMHKPSYKSMCGSPGIEFEYYSIAYFESPSLTLCSAAFARGGAHMRFIDASDIHAFT